MSPSKVWASGHPVNMLIYASPAPHPHVYRMYHTGWVRYHGVVLVSIRFCRQCYPVGCGRHRAKGTKSRARHTHTASPDVLSRCAAVRVTVARECRLRVLSSCSVCACACVSACVRACACEKEKIAIHIARRARPATITSPHIIPPEALREYIIRSRTS